MFNNILSNKHSQKFYARVLIRLGHKARAESLCARGASCFYNHSHEIIKSDLNVNDKPRNRLPEKATKGCLLRSNFTGKMLFWSSSPYAPNSNNAWNVNFNNGNDNANNKSNNNRVRLVRSGEWYGASY